MDEMEVPENTGKRSGRTMMAILLLPTLPLRLTFLGMFVFVVVTTIAPSYASYAWIEIILLFLVAGGFAARDSIRRAGSEIGLQRGMAAVGSVVVIGLTVILATRFVAAGGAFGAASNHTLRLRYVDFDLVVVALGLLLWIPQLFFDIQLDLPGTGGAQRVLLGLIAVTASIVTGAYVLLQHFGGGSLRQISIGPLVAGVAGLVVLITPIYRSLARACWSRGISGIVQFGQYRQDWGKTLIELRKAIDRASAPSSIGSAVESAAIPPRSERPAQGLAQGWPRWGLLSACALLAFGVFIAYETRDSNNYAATAAGLLIILAFITALACAVGMLLRRITRRSAAQQPAGATQHGRISHAPGAALPTSTEEAMATDDVQSHSGNP